MAATKSHIRKLCILAGNDSSQATMAGMGHLADEEASGCGNHNHEGVLSMAADEALYLTGCRIQKQVSRTSTWSGWVTCRGLSSSSSPRISSRAGFT
jgi:hypothetical protein